MSLAQQIIGTWILVSSIDIEPDGTTSDTWGPDPLGTYMFDTDGRFTQIVMRADLPKVASRELTTPDQARAVVMGSLAMFGSYTVDEAAGVIDVHFTGCTFASFNGTSGKRRVTMVSADEMQLSNAARAGGRSGRSVWRRVGQDGACAPDRSGRG